MTSISNLLCEPTAHTHQYNVDKMLKSHNWGENFNRKDSQKSMNLMSKQNTILWISEGAHSIL
jgi:hypothetical protein